MGQVVHTKQHKTNWLNADERNTTKRKKHDFTIRRAFLAIIFFVCHPGHPPVD